MTHRDYKEISTHSGSGAILNGAPKKTKKALLEGDGVVIITVVAYRRRESKLIPGDNPRMIYSKVIPLKNFPIKNRGEILSYDEDDDKQNEVNNKNQLINQPTISNDTGTPLAQDLTLLRQTIILPQKPPVRASSGEAVKAASRIFDRLDFVGMSKKHVLWILGDPATISDYGLKAGTKIDDPLIYCISTGLFGTEYKIEFKKGYVSKIQKIGLE